jgi:nucleotide-binding universal stress UspA family protein
MKNILVALDFRTNSGLLVDHAAALGKAFGAKIWLIHTDEPVPEYVGLVEIYPDFVSSKKEEELEQEQKMLSTLVRSLKRDGIEAESILAKGPTVETLLEQSKQINADLLIVGFHPKRPLFRALVGDTSFELLRSSGTPLMVIPLEAG